MKPKISTLQARRWIVQALADGGSAGLAKRIGEHFKVSRVTGTSVIHRLIAGGWLESSGGRHPTYSLGRNREIVRSFLLPGIDEHMTWENDFSKWFDLPANVAGIAHHGFTKMLNNANDHSCGKTVTVVMRLFEGVLTIVVIDDGVGIFEKITSSLKLPDKRLAILELSKGKFTTDPKNHSGEGIFFTSRMFDQFQIEANGLHYDHDVRDTHDWLLEIEMPKTAIGTLVYMALPTTSARTAREVFDEYSEGNDYGFNKTVVPVRLAKIGNENLVSRSQAKRLVARFEGFRTVILDFDDVDDIGQAFSDEIFRVFANAHPEVHLVPVKATPAVQQMITRATSAKSEPTAPPQF